MKKTTITFGKVALETERAAMARSGSLGGQVMAFEHMVERLAGGFLKIVDVMTLREVVASCLADTDLGELEGVKDMPGMTTACADSLMAWWMSGLSFDSYAGVPRMEAIRSLDEAVTAKLPPHVRKPADIVELACGRVGFAPRVFGEITFKGMTDLHPVWRPVLEALVEVPDYVFVWDAGPYPVPQWVKQIPRESIRYVSDAKRDPSISAETASDSRHEVLEALRWAMGLLAAGHRGEDIAIAAVSAGAYSGIVHTIAREIDFEIHMPNGIPALQTSAGQECAALADILLRGISHKRMRRLYEASPRSPAFDGLSAEWLSKIPQDASLLTVERWHRLLDRNVMSEAKPYLYPVIELLAKGVSAAEEAGKSLLSEAAAKLWDRAIKSGPATALDQTLKTMRSSTGGTSLDKVCFMSAMELVAAPRRFVRLLGLTSRQWPRRDGDDNLIPNYIVPTRMLSPMSVAEMDRRDFHSILSTTSDQVVLSWPRMDGDGREMRPSTLVKTELVATAARHDRARRTRYATCESDRMFMRAAEFAATPSAIKAKTASINWSRPNINEHDGSIPANHPRIEAVFGQVQSATSLQKMIRDPLGYVWKYALGFHAPEFEDEPILVDSRVFGNVVHDILKTAVDKLTKRGGFATCSEAVVRQEVFKARSAVSIRMEQSQPIPPTLIWTQTLDRAEEAAVRALRFDYGAMPSMQSFAEIPFGWERDWIPDELPWAEDREVFIEGTGIRIRGILDRLDLSFLSGTTLSRVVDYKTGKTPTKPDEIGINGGLELQRAIFGFAVKTLLDGCENIESALYYPLTDTYVPMVDIEAHMDAVASAVKVAQEVLRAGNAYPGIAAAEAFNDMLFAFPARATTVYLPNKMSRIGTEFDELKKVWETK